MNLFELKTKIEQITAEVSEYARTRALNDIGEEAVEFYSKAFQSNVKGFTDKSLERWAPLKRPNHARGESNILVRSGNLSRSIEADVQEKKVIIRAEAFSGKGFNYAPVHNAGTDRIPQRRFVAHSQALNKLITERLQKKVSDIINKTTR